MRMLEIERKRHLSDDGHEIVNRLEKAGYRLSDSYIEIDTYYTRPDVDYVATVECLRVRQRPGFAEITYKPASTADTSRDGMTIKSETDLPLVDSGHAAVAHELLTNIGMTVLARVEKKRVLFRHPQHDDVTITVDTLADVGVFVETEVMAVDSERAIALLDRVELSLGLTGSPIAALPYRDLVLRYSGAGLAK